MCIEIGYKIIDLIKAKEKQPHCYSKIAVNAYERIYSPKNNF
jgi:hypothetical protein